MSDIQPSCRKTFLTRMQGGDLGRSEWDEVSSAYMSLWEEHGSPLKNARGRDNQNSAMPLLPVCYSRDDINRCCQLPSPVSMKGQGETPILIQGAVIRWSGAHGIGIQF
jgi:hypothetical protein